MAREINDFLYCCARGFIGPEDIVIDAGCGEGIGTDVLSTVAKKVVGIDKDKAVVQKAMVQSKKENNYFICNNLDQLDGFPTNDVTVLIDTLEYLRFPESLIGKIKMSTKRLIILTVKVDVPIDVLIEDDDWSLTGKLLFGNKLFKVYERADTT